MDNFKIVLTAVSVWLAYLVYLGVYRVYFSPVAHVPGPLLAKLTYWYEFYYDVVCVGRYIFKIRDLHAQYGPIIRINPDEVHVIDPEFYDELYIGPSSTRKRNKWFWMYDSFGIPASVFSTTDHEVHRMRRNALGVFFSKAKVRKLQDRVVDIGTRFLDRLAEFQTKGEPMPLGLAWTAVTSDIAGSYSYGKQLFRRIDAPDFSPNFHIASEAAAKQSHIVKQFPSILSVMKMLPDEWANKMDPNMGTYIKMQRDLQQKTAKIQEDYKSPDYKPPEETTVFHEILNSPHLPESEKHHDRLWQEGQIVVVAGTVTTAVTLSYLVYYLLSQPEDLKRLRQEIFKVMPNKDAVPDLKVLEAQPFLSACIMEALRLSNGLSTRLARQDPDNAIVYTDNTQSTKTSDANKANKKSGKMYILPPNTPISMTTMLMHLNPDYFEDPMSYKPDRWLDLKSPTLAPSTTDAEVMVESKYMLHGRLNKYYAPFSRGTRACIGINLAQAELYILLAMLFRRYGSAEVKMDGDDGVLDLYKTTYENDIEIVGDGITPIIREGQRGMMIMVR